MKILLLLLSLFFFSSPSVFADDIDLYELSIQYPQCQDSDYRDECFDDFSFGNNRWVGYFRDNLMWEGLIWQNDVLTHEKSEGVQKGVSNCHKGLDDWYNCPSGNKYKPLEGGYHDDNGRQGRFSFHLPDGSVFEGNYENGVKNGYGKMTWSSGSVYEGNYENGLKNGYGKMTWPDGDVYEGNWKNDYLNGFGKYTWPDGGVYEGNWENYNQHGYGRMTWSDGEVYEGNWENGNMSD